MTLVVYILLGIFVLLWIIGALILLFLFPFYLMHGIEGIVFWVLLVIFGSAIFGFVAVHSAISGDFDFFEFIFHELPEIAKEMKNKK